MFVSYKCPTCGESFAMSADAWQWHRLVDHPRAGLPFVGRPIHASPFVRRALAAELPAKETYR